MSTSNLKVEGRCFSWVEKRTNLGQSRKMLSDEQLSDIAEAYSPEQILEILDISSLEILLQFREQVQENLTKFEVRPVDCDEI